MTRRREIPKRKILPDPKYNSRLVAKFTNILMRGGKKSTAEQIIHKAFHLIGQKGKGEDPVAVFRKALDNIKPLLEVKSRRIGGATYQVPIEVRSNRRSALAMRWLKKYSIARSERTMSDRLAAEILEASENRGASIKKREDTHKMAEANKAFSHYRW